MAGAMAIGLMPHSNAEKQAAYPKVRVYAATRELLRQLAQARGESMMQTIAAAVEALIRDEARRARRGA